jgi:hypothetical protein
MAKKESPVKGQEKGHLNIFSFSLELDHAGILQRFGKDILEEHSFGAFGFSLKYVQGANPEEQLLSILTEIVVFLKESSCKKHISLSIYFEPEIYEGWCSESGPAVCVYLGCSDGKFSTNCNYDQLNNHIRGLSSYINAEAYSPSDNALFLGYFSPVNKTLYLEKRNAMSWCIVKKISPEEYFACKNNPKDLISTIPADIMQVIKDKKVIEAGFGAGPGFAAGMIQKYPEPVELPEGISWIEKYCHILKAAHLLLDDRTTLWFHRDGFNRYDHTLAERPPRHGVEVITSEK